MIQRQRQGRESRMVAMLDIYDVQVHPEASRAMKERHGIKDGTNEQAFLQAVTPNELRTFSNPENPDYRKAYDHVMNVFESSIRSGDLELTLLEGTSEALEYLSEGGMTLGCFSLGSDETIRIPLERFGLDKYYQNPELLVPVKTFGYEASKSRPETFRKLAQHLEERGYKLGMFADDNAKYVKAAVKSGVIEPHQAFHVQKGYSGQTLVEEEGVQYMRVSSLGEVPKILHQMMAQASRSRSRVGEAGE